MVTSLLAAALLVAAPTGPLRDIHPGPASGLRAAGENATLDWDPWLGTLPDRVLFEAAAADRVTRLWASDGSAAGTQGLAAIDVDEAFDAGTQVFLLVRPDGRLHGLWRSDGTPAGTRAIAVPSIPDTTPTPLGVFAGRLLFANDYGGDGRELWISDGTDAGTALLADLNPRGSGRPDDVVDLGARAVFTAGSASGRELWTTDGSRVGTAQVADLAPGAASAFVLGGARLHRVGPAVVFPAVGGVWRSDGTPAGTARLADLGTARVTASFALGDRVFILTTEPPALWASDGSAEGTRVVARGLTRPRAVGAVGTTALFFAVDGDGEALWASDGSRAGTQRLRALRSDPVRRLATACLPGACVFAADGDGGGSEPWRSDGRAAGTRQLADLRPGPAGSQPLGFTAAAGRLVFLADDGAHGVEAWTTRGTAGDARLLADLAPGAASGGAAALAVERPFAVTPTHLFLAADDGAHGREAWAIPRARLAPAGDCDGDGQVAIADLVRAVRVALGAATVATCPDLDADGDGSIAIDELIDAVASALAE